MGESVFALSESVKALTCRRCAWPPPSPDAAERHESFSARPSMALHQDANENAIKAARLYTGRHKVRCVCLTDNPRATSARPDAVTENFVVSPFPSNPIPSTRSWRATAATTARARAPSR